MPQWCDRHKQHTIDESCWKCDRESQLAAAAPAMYQAIRGYLEWGAMTWSDRYLHEQRFKQAIESLTALEPLELPDE